MIDRNRQQFHGRLGRIERVHEAGGGFEAEGTLGMSYFKPRKRARLSGGLMGPLVLVLMTVIGIKAAVHASIGPEVYQERIAALEAGDQVEKIGAYILRADPLTLLLAEQFRKIRY